MTAFEDGRGEQTLADYIVIARRHKWLIVAITAAIPLAAYVWGAQQPEVFRASSEVLLTRQDLGSALTGIPNPNAYIDPVRYAETQAALARVPEVARMTVERGAVRDITADELLASSEVSPRDNADLLRFTVDDRRPEVATRLATAYAEAFTAYKLKADTGSFALAREELQDRLAELRRQGATETALYRDLADKAQELRTLELLQAQATVVRPATDVTQIAPRPTRNAVLGAILGLVLGLGAAFVRNTLDRRIRTEEEVERVLGLPLLARLPTPARRFRAEDRLTMLDEPSNPAAESVRLLRTNLELANLEAKARVIMVTSAAPVEGKTTTVANLAVALARGGRSVALVDLDLRQPLVASLFGLDGRPGVSNVLLGEIGLDKAVVSVPLPIVHPRSVEDGTMRVTSRLGMLPTGRLGVLPTGPRPANPGELVGTPALVTMLDRLREDHDVVLVDAPPLLAVGDAMTLSTTVDAVFVVVRLGLADRRLLKELRRALDAAPAHKLGFVLTGVDLNKHYGASSYYRYLKPRQPPKQDDRKNEKDVSPPAPLPDRTPTPRPVPASGRWATRGAPSSDAWRERARPRRRRAEDS